MRKIKMNQNGITLITLVVTIIMLLILASVATYSGIEVIKSSKLTTFTTEMKIMQTQVNELYETDRENATAIGKNISDVKAQADKVFTTNASGITDQTGYRYFDQDTIKQLGIERVKGEFFVNIERRSVISFKGFEYEGKTYYTLEQLPNGLYNVQYQDKNTGEPTFEIDYKKIADKDIRITISNIQYDGYIEKWKVKYQKEGQEYWNTSEDLTFSVKEDGIYKIKIVNGEIESQEKEQLIVTEYSKDGLILHYDGINNTGNGDYKNNGLATVWKDLSGNNNDGILYNMNTETGYYSEKDKGYVFLENSSYVKSTNRIGISGDPQYTIETVVNVWSDGKVPGYSAYSAATPLWFGGLEANVGGSSIFSYNRNRKTFNLSFINNWIDSTNTYENILDKNIYMSCRRHMTGTITPQATDAVIMNFNGSNIDSLYTGTIDVNCDITDSEVEIGRSWQWKDQNRPFYGVVKAVRIYNRALTDQETNLNYQLDKIRFDLDDVH